ncbi:MAG: zf-HC2 domain-containing protein [Gemmatimonadota bacterium]
MEHPDEGLIHTWLDGQLSEAEAATLETHVASCAACRAAVAEARGFVAAASRVVSSLDDVPRGVIPKPEPKAVPSLRPAAPVATKRVWWSRPQLAAAALVFVMAGGVIVRGLGVGDDVVATEVSQSDVSEAASPLMDGAAPAPRIAGPSVQRELAENATAASERVAGKVAAPRALERQAAVGGAASAARATSKASVRDAAPAGNAAADLAVAAPATPPSATVTSQRAETVVVPLAQATTGATGNVAGGRPGAGAGAGAGGGGGISARSSVAAAAEQRAMASAPAPAPPVAAPEAQLQAKSFAAAGSPSLEGCYMLRLSPAEAAGRFKNMPTRFRLVDSLSIEGRSLRVAYDLDNPSSRLAWLKLVPSDGVVSFVLHRLIGDSTYTMIVHVGIAPAPDKRVAVRGGC